MNTPGKVDSFLLIPYELRTPEQRWAIFCLECRKRKNWKRSQLADYLGVATSSVFYWESAKVFPKNEIIYKMAELDSKSVDDLIAYLHNSKSQSTNNVTINNIHDLVKLTQNLSCIELLQLIKQLTEVMIAKQT